jgi:nucleoside-diphosphate-sugar epimerase
MVFVTGGTGFLGAHLLTLLTKEGKTVKALKRKSSNTSCTEKLFKYKFGEDWNRYYSLITWVEGDIMDIIKLTEAMQGADEVFHCAAFVTLRDSGAEEVIKTAETGTENLVNSALALNVKKFCHVSSVAALGRPPEGEYTDEGCFESFSYDNAPYSIGKHLAELQVCRGMAEGLKAVIVNPSIIFGPWSNLSVGSIMLFSNIERNPYFYTNGVMGFVDVKDVTQIMLLLMDNNKFGERYILSSENMRFRELFTEIALQLGKPLPKFKINRTGLNVYRIFHNLVSPYKMSRTMVEHATTIHKFKNDKIIKTIGCQLIPVKESIKETAQFYRGEKRK